VTFIDSVASEIGLETALTFAERGCQAVVFADQSFEGVQAGSEKSKTIATAKDYDTFAIAVDARDRSSVKAMVTEVVKKYGRLDYAINCAGVRIYI
jgi:NAD(P)-dependent dehydrogenase (short-subunit alcohol dehydrogenase family)